MLERIYIAIFNMPCVVGLVTYQVLPKSALPNSALVACSANSVELLRSGIDAAYHITYPEKTADYAFG
jgi:hypothetical protein